MSSSSTVVSFRQPDAVDDPLTAVLRDGARRLLVQAIEAEAEAFLATMREMRLPDGRERLVRHGHGPERQVQTGIGPVAVQRAKLRDRGAQDRQGAQRRAAQVVRSDPRQQAGFDHDPHQRAGQATGRGFGSGIAPVRWFSRTLRGL